MTLEEEITLLTAKWYKYVSMDHHKDRDCHWHIEKIYSYGEEPYYIAYHNGYIGERWTSPKLGSIELAETMICNRLNAEIHNAINHLNSIINDQEMLNWMVKTKEEIEEVIKELQ